MKKANAETSNVTSFRNVFFNLSVFQFLTFVRRGVFYTFMINYLYTLMQSATLTAALGTLNMVASALGQNLLWGRISDRYKLRTKLIMTGESIAGFAYIIVFIIHKSLIQTGDHFLAGLAIIFGLSILEFFWSMSDVGWATLLTDVTTPEIRGRIIGTLNFIASLGRMVGILFAGFLYADGDGFKNGTIFYIVTILLFIGAAMMALMSRHTAVKSATQKNLSVKEKEEHKGKLTDENEKTYSWFLASLIIIVLGAASINQIFLLFIKLTEGLNASDPEMSLILGTWTIGGMIASIVLGRLADKVGRNKVMFLGLILAAITPLLYGVALTVPLMALIYGLNGVSFWTIQTVGFAIAGDIIPEHKRGRLLSRYNAVMAIGWGPAGFLVGGPLADIQVKIL
ncbi:MAG: MFS transporter, partial [Candidatus Bathyarchaeota archaeon]|nr:MFS transporter [Candidatus Bathyarchaeota archaeon]